MIERIKGNEEGESGVGQRQSQVTANMEGLYRNLEKLDAHIGNLEDGLSRVLRESDPEPVENGEDLEKQVPLAEAIRDMSKRIQHAQMRIYSMLDRLEL